MYSEEMSKEILESFLRPATDHPFNKCGICTQRVLLAQVAKDFLEQNKSFTHKEFNDEFERRWHRTELYQKVRSMMNRGMDIDQIEEELEKNGVFL